MAVNLLQHKMKKALRTGQVTAEQLAFSWFPGYIALQYPDYEFAPHNIEIAKALMRVEAGLTRRLIVSMPPRHGKTMQISEYFPPWYIGRNPSRQIIATSYNFDRANDVGRKVRNQLIDPLHQMIFPDCHISMDSKGANKLSTMEGGNYYSVGVGGATIGRGAHLFLVDDPISGREAANSETSRNKLLDWYRGVAYTRLMPENAIIVVMTRWHFYDLVGYLLEESVGQWELLELPAIATKEDIIGRQPGDPLWPEHFPLERLQEIQQEVGTVEWNAQYQQRPLPAEGGMIELGWFKRYDHEHWLTAEMGVRMGGNPRIPLGIKQIVMSLDTAFKEKQINDPSSITVWGISKDCNYLLNCINKRLKYPELKELLVETYDHYHRFGLGPVSVLIEDKGSGQSLIQEIRHHTQIPVFAIPAVTEKKTRMSTATPLIEAGRVALPYRAPWLVRYETQLAQFPYGKEDDDADSTAQFLNWVGKPRYKKRKHQSYWK